MAERRFTKKYVEVINDRMSERDKMALKHFGYDKPIGAVNSTGDNTNPFENIGFVIQTLGIDKTCKTRITFDYDPNFAHCLLQISQINAKVNDMEELTKNLKELINKSMISFLESERVPTPDEILKISDAVEVTAVIENPTAATEGISKIISMLR